MQSCYCLRIFYIIILLSDVCVKSLFTNFIIFNPWPLGPIIFLISLFYYPAQGINTDSGGGSPSVVTVFKYCQQCSWKKYPSCALVIYTDMMSFKIAILQYLKDLEVNNPSGWWYKVRILKNVKRSLTDDLWDCVDDNSEEGLRTDAFVDRILER